jgi:hypothetical protein
MPLSNLYSSSPGAKLQPVSLKQFSFAPLFVDAYDACL